MFFFFVTTSSWNDCSAVLYVCMEVYIAVRTVSVWHRQKLIKKWARLLNY